MEIQYALHVQKNAKRQKNRPASEILVVPERRYGINSRNCTIVHDLHLVADWMPEHNRTFR